MKKAIENHNKSIQMKWINSIRELPNYKESDLSCAGDEAFKLPIVEITPDQKSNLKKLIDENQTISRTTRSNN